MKLKLMHIRNGIKFGYPICCILRFTFSRQQTMDAKERGLRYKPDGSATYVPCCVFHKAHRSWDRQILLDLMFYKNRKAS